MKSIVALDVIEQSIAQIKLQDVERKNMITLDLQKEVLKAFEEVERSDDVKVIVVCGFDRYFCTGGSREDIDAVAAKSFREVFPFFSLLADCSLPIVSAMQGHALGGGLAFGCYGDILLMAEEARYSANFMSYGFTPGFGATHVLPMKLGTTLAQEMMLTARYYSGKELASRGVQARVLPSKKVLEEAHQIARELALLPKTALVELKKNYSLTLKEGLAAAVNREEQMHNRTFHTKESRDLIDRHFGA